MWPFRFAMHGKRGLRMMVVALLSSSPKNGVELIDGVEAMTRGWWRPSPGSVYPLLERMAEEGTVRKREDGKYELTPKANAELEVSFGSRFRSPRTTEGLVTELQSLVLYAEDLAKSKPDELAEQREKLKDLAKRLDDLAKQG
jgi:DNA-binding PadR family transcriptional regulator